MLKGSRKKPWGRGVLCQIEQPEIPGSCCGWETGDRSNVSSRVQGRCEAGEVKMPSQEKSILRALISQRVREGYCK